MKKIKMKKIFAYGIVLFALFFVVSACSKEDEIVSDYVGTWVASTTMDDDLEAKETLILTYNTFSNQYQVKDSISGSWIDYITMKGSITVDKQLITGTITEIGLAIDLMTGEPTGTMTTYKAGSSLFDMIVEESAGSATFNSEYSISGNTLTLKTDDNNDGDFLDDGESQTFIKQ